jgi:hypothetical protein
MRDLGFGEAAFLVLTLKRASRDASVKLAACQHGLFSGNAMAATLRAESVRLLNAALLPGACASLARVSAGAAHAY